MSGAVSVGQDLDLDSLVASAGLLLDVAPGGLDDKIARVHALQDQVTNKVFQMRRELELSALPITHKAAGRKVLCVFEKALANTSTLCCCVIQTCKEHRVAVVSLQEAHEKLRIALPGSCCLAFLHLLSHEQRQRTIDELINKAQSILDLHKMSSLDDAVHRLGADYSEIGHLIETEISNLAKSIKGHEWWNSFYKNVGKLKYVMYALGAAALIIDGGILAANMVAIKSALAAKVGATKVAQHSSHLLPFIPVPPEDVVKRMSDDGKKVLEELHALKGASDGYTVMLPEVIRAARTSNMLLDLMMNAQSSADAVAHRASVKALLARADTGDELRDHLASLDRVLKATSGLQHASHDALTLSSF